MVETSAQATESANGQEGAAVIRGMAVALLGALLGGGLGFVFLVVMARLLDQAEFGLLVVAINILLAAGILSIAGADYATIYFVAAADSPGRKRGAIGTAVGLVLAFNLAIAAVVFALAGPFSTHLLGEPAFENVLRALAFVLPLTVLAQMFSASLSGLEQARGELARKVVEQLGRIALALAALALGLGLVGVVVGMAVAAVAAAAVVGYLLLRSLPRGGVTERVSARQVFVFSWPQALANASRQVWVMASILILARSTDAQTVALFGAAFAISRLPLLIYNAFAFRFSPTIARLWARGEREALGATLKSVTRWVAIVAVPFYAVAIALPGPLLEIYGPSYREGAAALAIMTAATLLNSLAGPVERALVMSNHVRLEMISNVVSGFVALGAALVLTPTYGLIGAALSSLVYTIVSNGMKSYFVWRVLRMNAFSYSLLAPLAAATIASLLVAGLAGATTLDASLVGTVALGVMLLVVYGLVLVRVIGVSETDRQTLTLVLRSTRPERR